MNDIDTILNRLEHKTVECTRLQLELETKVKEVVLRAEAQVKQRKEELQEEFDALQAEHTRLADTFANAPCVTGNSVCPADVRAILGVFDELADDAMKDAAVLTLKARGHPIEVARNNINCVWPKRAEEPNEKDSEEKNEVEA